MLHPNQHLRIYSHFSGLTAIISSITMFLLCLGVTLQAADKPLSPIPSDKVQEQIAEKLQKELGKDAITKNTADTARLAKKLEQIAAWKKLSPDTRYVVLRNAYELHIKSLEPARAFVVVDTLARTHNVKVMKLKKTILQETRKLADSYTDRVKIAQASLLLCDALLQKGRLKECADLLMSTKKELVKLKNKDFASTCKILSQALRTARSNRKILEKSKVLPDSETASPNLVLRTGRHYCLVQSDWTKGIGLLAKSRDKELRKLAIREQAAKSMVSKIRLADAWSEYGRSVRGISRVRAFQHALECLRQASALAGTNQQLGINAKAEQIKSMLGMELGAFQVAKYDWALPCFSAVSFDKKTAQKTNNYIKISDLISTNTFKIHKKCYLKHGYIGASSSIGFSLSVPLNAGLSENNMTICAWIYPTDITRNKLGLLFDWADPPPKNQLAACQNAASASALLVDKSGQVIFCSQKSNFQVVADKSPPLETAKWHHVAIVMAADYIDIYVNGLPTRISPKGLTRINIRQINICIFKSRFWKPLGIGFRIDEVCVWKQAFSRREILDLYRYSLQKNSYCAAISYAAKTIRKHK